jgi:hypothetical protein
MDPLTNLYERLRAQAPGTPPIEPPLFEQWLQYWNDEDSDFGNLRNFQHWIARGLKTSSKRCEGR